ncbi:MAG: phosphatase PAP2 family protein [Peptococcaceae bacterium]|nr:phosphatase PAP2 family protein [Peptococcaceae bacterium]
MNSFDLFGYHLLNHWAGHIPLLDTTMSFLAQYALEIYALLFVIAWFVLPKPEVKRRNALVVMGLAGVLALLLNVLLAHLWFRPRPFVTLKQGSFTQLIPHSADSSFPSDHAAGSFGFAAGSWYRAERWVSISFTCLAVLVGVARVYVGVHWPTDVIAGVIVGIVSAVIMKRFSDKFEPLTRWVMRILGFKAYDKKQGGNNIA